MKTPHPAQCRNSERRIPEGALAGYVVLAIPPLGLLALWWAA